MALSACLAASSPAFAQQASPPNTAQEETAEWLILTQRAKELFNVEFAKLHTGQPDYKGVLALSEQAERSAERQFGAGSDPHLAALHAHASYLGLSGNERNRGAYDRQLQIANKIFSFRAAKIDKQSLPYAMALIRFTGDLTSHFAPHKAVATRALEQAHAILTTKGEINNDDLANSWSAYGQQLRFYSQDHQAIASAIYPVVMFRFQKKEGLTQSEWRTCFIEANIIASAFNASGDKEGALSYYNLARLAARSHDSFPPVGTPTDKLMGSAMLLYGYQLMHLGRAVDAEPYLTEGVEDLISSGAKTLQLEYAQNQLAEARAAKAAELAKAEAARRATAAATATEATRGRRIAPTPSLAEMLRRLGAAGVIVNTKGAM